MMIKIADKSIGLTCEPFIIAEMSGNHNQSLDRALEIVSEIALTGAHALKIQTYTPDTMTLKSGQAEFFINDPKSLWNGRSLYDLYGEGQTPWEWHKPIFDFAKKLGLIAFSTPFDSTSVDFLEELNVPCYKIASFENIDLALIAKVAKTGKPIIISTGMASLSELQDIVMTARAAGCNDIILLKCTSTYPAEPVNSNLLTIPHLKELFNCEVGLSDHTMGVGVSVASVALGATVIEKHFTLSRADGGVDSAFSMEPNEMAQLVVETNRAWKSLGKISYGPTPAEMPSLQFRRSIYVIKDIECGELLTIDNIGIIRPGLGLPPKYIDIVLGKVAKKDLSRGTALNWEHI
jgi:pseudaminic acid synthase